MSKRGKNFNEIIDKYHQNQPINQIIGHTNRQIIEFTSIFVVYCRLMTDLFVGFFLPRPKTLDERCFVLLHKTLLDGLGFNVGNMPTNSSSLCFAY